MCTLILQYCYLTYSNLIDFLRNQSSSRYCPASPTVPCGSLEMVLSVQNSNVLRNNSLYPSSSWGTRAERHFIAFMQVRWMCMLFICCILWLEETNTLYQTPCRIVSHTVADLFVCPSLTETFGQTVNEALASRVRVALPNVPVFSEAYGSAVPADAFWTPLSRSDMASSILKQLERHSRNDRFGLPDLDKLKSWEDACQILLEDYHKAFEDRHNTFTFFAWVYFPAWCAMTITTIISIFIFSQIRCFCGGSVRVFFRSAAEDLLIKVDTLFPVVLPPS